METELLDFVEVSHSAVGDCPDAPQGLVHVAVDLSPERADGIRVVEVLDDYYSGLR